MHPDHLSRVPLIQTGKPMTNPPRESALIWQRLLSGAYWRSANSSQSSDECYSQTLTMHDGEAVYIDEVFGRGGTDRKEVRLSREDISEWLRSLPDWQRSSIQRWARG